MFTTRLVRGIQPMIQAHRSIQMPVTSSFSKYVKPPENMQEMNDALKAQAAEDRSREVSGMQVTRMFSGQFMSSQDTSEDTVASGIDQSIRGKHADCFDLDGNASLGAGLQTNVPEPFKASNEDLLKEGIPTGLADCQKDQNQRWTMEDRLDHSYIIDTKY